MKQLYLKSSVVFFIIMSFSCSSKRLSSESELLNYTEFRNLQHSFETAEGNIKYIDKGKGDVILLLHGVPTSSWLYRNMIDTLVSQGYRVIAPDMLGFGSSDNPKGYDVYSPEKHAIRLLNLMKSLNINSWNHVMHDAGGLWTWELIKLSPKKIKNLVILNTIIYEEGFQPPIRMESGNFAKFSMWLYKNGITTSTMLNKLFDEGLKYTELSAEAFEGYKTPLMEGKTRAMYQFFTNTCNSLPDYSNVIKQIDIPTAIIWGKHDSFLKWSVQRERVMADLKIKAQNEYILNTSHFLQEEAPNLVSKYITKFIKTNN